jgi:hypothetical protein
MRRRAKFLQHPLAQSLGIAHTGFRKIDDLVCQSISRKRHPENHKGEGAHRMRGGIVDQEIVDQEHGNAPSSAGVISRPVAATCGSAIMAP